MYRVYLTGRGGCGQAGEGGGVPAEWISRVDAGAGHGYLPGAAHWLVNYLM